MIDLDTLPAPAVVLPLDYEAILSAALADLADRLRPYLPGIDTVLQLESEPLTKLVQSHAYRELLFRAWVNDAARAHLLAFATGGDLDHLCALFGVLRLEDEGDERLRTRIALRIAAMAGNGTREYYEFTALSASTQVRAVRASSPAAGFVVVMLWLQDQTQALAVRALVDAAIKAEATCMLGVEISIAVAQPLAIDITARITRTRRAPGDLMALLMQRLQAGLDGATDMDGSLARSYITTLLHIDGVHAVEYPDSAAPAPVTPIGAGQYPVLGVVQLIDAGAV